MSISLPVASVLPDTSISRVFVSFVPVTSICIRSPVTAAARDVSVICRADPPVRTAPGVISKTSPVVRAAVSMSKASPVVNDAKVTSTTSPLVLTPLKKLNVSAPVASPSVMVSAPVVVPMLMFLSTSDVPSLIVWSAVCVSKLTPPEALVSVTLEPPPAVKETAPEVVVIEIVPESPTLTSNPAEFNPLELLVSI